MASSYSDDNFGNWEGMDDPDMVEFYHETQKRSVVKKCSRCGRKVKIMPQYAYCNTCTDAIERGVDY